MNRATNLAIRFLRMFTDIRSGEAGTALLLTLNVYLLLCAYYFIKPAREALILVLDSGAEYKSYASAAMALLLLPIVPLYACLAERLPRNRLIVSVTLFFAMNLVVFFALGQLPGVRSQLGIPFYLWVGIFNMMVVAQFWAFANDIYDDDQGRRLFPLVAFGASAGAVSGSKIAAWLIAPLGVYGLLLAGALLLLATAVLTQWVHVRQPRFAARETTSGPSHGAAAGGEGLGAFALLLRHRYLLVIALFTLTFTLVNTNGEYILSKAVAAAAATAEAAGALGTLSRGEYIGRFYGDFFFVVNAVALLVQLFVVSRVVRFGGVRWALLLPGLFAFGGGLVFAMVPVLGLLRWTKTAENATDYSLNNTVRAMLWLPTTAEMKYKAKQAVDTFFVRMGDVGSALLVFASATLLELTLRQFALVNVGLAVVWLLLGAKLGQEYGRLTRGGTPQTAAP